LYQVVSKTIFVLTGRNCEKVKKPARFPARSFHLRRKFDTQRLQIIEAQNLTITVLCTPQQSLSSTGIDCPIDNVNNGTRSAKY